MIVTTSDGTAFQIDADDALAISYYVWYLGKGGYIQTYRKEGVFQTRVLLHHFLLGKAPEGLIWDHWNQDKLDNRRENFRAVTRAINGRNAKLYSNNKSGVRGVAWYAPMQCRYWGDVR